MINGIVGAGIFGLPAKVQSLLGVYGLAAILVCAAIVGLVILCFAEVASRFDETGGPFVYVGAAFGPFAGFLTGWVLWLARVTGCCAICNLLLQYIAFVSPDSNRGIGRAMTASAILGALTVIHFLGVKRAALFGNIVTVAKLIPLLVFVAVGILQVDPARFALAGQPINAHFAEAVLLLGFAFVGWESVVVSAGETRNPQRDLPLALIAGLCLVAILYMLIQVVCIGTFPGLATSERPIVEAAIEPWMRKAIGLEGLSICPETAVCFAALEILLARGDVGPGERIVVFNTGAAQKSPEAVHEEIPFLDIRRQIDWALI